MTLIGRLIVTVVALSSVAAFAAKPPPPPPPPPTGCTGPATFPSIVFGKLVQTGSGVTSSWDIYVGNGDGTCAVKVYSIAGVTANNVAMAALNDSQYRIAWVQAQRASKNDPYRATVKMIQFSVVNHLINEPLPLSPSTLYSDQLDTSAAAIYGVGLSSDANSVVFTRKTLAGLELKLLDIFACTPACQVTTPFTDTSPYDDAYGAVFGPVGTNRIYFTAKRTGQPWGAYLLEDGVGPRLVASMADYGEPLVNLPRQIYWPHTTRIDHTGAPTNGVWLSFSAATRDPNTQASIKGVDVLDVTNCTTTPLVFVPPVVAVTGSCLENGIEASVVSHDIPGEIGSGGWKGDGSLLRTRYVGAPNRAIDAVDWLAPFDTRVPHGPGLMPDGIK